RALEPLKLANSKVDARKVGECPRNALDNVSARKHKEFGKAVKNESRAPKNRKTLRSFFVPTTSDVLPKRLTYTIAGAAQILGVALSTMRKLLASGELPHSRVGRRRVLIEYAELEKFLRRSRVRRG